jgi:SecD/SecF fusion protein
MKAQQKRKALFVILAVSALTLYNILPTIFFYSNNLKGEITKSSSMKIAADIAKRVNKLEGESVAWIHSYCKLLHIKPAKVSLKEKSPDAIYVSFNTEKDARVFKSHMTRAGNLIPFFPKRILPLESSNDHLDAKTVSLKREIPIHFDLNDIEKYFSYVSMYKKDGSISSEYRDILDDRVLEVSKVVTASSSSTTNIERTIGDQHISYKAPYFLSVADTLLQYKTLFEKDGALQKQFYSSIFQSTRHEPEFLYDHCLKGFQGCKDFIQKEKLALVDTIKEENLDENDSSVPEVGALTTLKSQEEKLLNVITLLQKKRSLFVTSRNSIDPLQFSSELKNKKIENKEIFTLSTGSNNPVISAIEVNYNDRLVTFEISDALMTFMQKSDTAAQKKITQLIFDEIANIKNTTSESIQRNGPLFTLDLTTLEDAKSLLRFDLKVVAEKKLKALKNSLENNWIRNSKELDQEGYKIVTWNTYKSLPDEEKAFCLALYAPVLEKGVTPEGFDNGSVYVIGKSLLLLNNNTMNKGAGEEGELLGKDLFGLDSLLRQYSARVYEGSGYPFSAEFKNDYIFKISDYFEPLLTATREDWNVIGSGTFATLEFSDVRNRILTVNNIENKEHADLLKWQDDYNRAQSNPEAEGHLSIPSPTKSPFLNNLALSTSKYFRGDEKKILHWGLDLNGGSTVRVALKDKQNRPVTSEEDLNQGVNELYRRVNKMGVSDVTIRKEGSFITLDFPATQSLSASELITASSMTFHVVNEKFSYYNASLRNPLGRFLQEVWNEALVTGKKDTESINEIAFNHLYGDTLDISTPLPRSDSGRILLENGLTLADPANANMTSTFDDKVSKIGVLEGDSIEDWQGMTNPLVVLFNNYALEGAWLKDVRSGYDASNGNYLSFAVNSSTSEEGIDPREVLHNWTSVFSTSQMDKREYSEITSGNGWRLSAVLNGKIISMPRLQDALKENGRISGSFTQKEVSRLAADLRAGSLTYTPEIISETTISPELGAKERSQGIFATVIAFLAVLAIMIGYYRFAGVIASIAVIFNILIIWATLQNLGASLTLAGIAGIILTIGMAVDANVLIFERIREENEAHGNILNAITNGYKKAFTAIFDSNITTIIAALILLNFDAGPVKGFALTLIIGITSSMFTALYMTRAFFSFWLKKGKDQSLKILNLIPDTGLSFMKYGRIATFVATAFIIVGGVTLYEQRGTLFGMDFTGGMTLELEVASSDGVNPKSSVEHALISHGIASSEFSIRELKDKSALKIYLSNALNNPGRPFADLAKPSLKDEISYSYEKNPKLAALVGILKDSNVALSEKSLSTLDKNFSAISGQMSETMRNNALFGLLLALLSILVYITVRFEFSYAISATIGLAFDLLLTLAILGICKACGLPLSIDLNTIAALMTIIGYSLNDTIIVFDRIRTELKKGKSTPLKEVIDLSLNKTLSRTIMTSLTTLVVLLSLVILGGKSIFNFSFLMMVGVIVGTISTLLLASTFLLVFKSKEKKKARSASIVSITG